MAVAENFTNIYRERRRFFALLLKLGWGVFAGLLESRGLPKIFCLISMLPIFSAMECRTRRVLVLKILPFLQVHQPAKTKLSSSATATRNAMAAKAYSKLLRT